MNRDLFQNRLIESLQRARDFAGNYFIEELPTAVRCRVLLNSSFDGNPLHTDEKVYPEDSSLVRSQATRSLTAEEAMAYLWRSGAVPEWIDVSVISRTASHTVIELRSCGRFTANDDLLYHAREGRPPFHVVGPGLPADYQQGDRFSIHQSASCWTIDEFRALQPRRILAWSLELDGPDFDDDFLRSIDEFPSLEGLILSEVPIWGPGLAGCSRMPKLRFLRRTAVAHGNFDLRSAPEMQHLEALSLAGLSGPPSGLEQLSAWAPSLTSLALDVDAIPSGLVLPAAPQLVELSLSAETIDGDVVFSHVSRLERLSMHGPFADETICHLLDLAPSVRSVDLDGTRAATGTVQKIRSRSTIKYVDLGGTLVDADTLAQLRAERPDMLIHG